MTSLPSFDTYGNYSGNYGAHALVFTDANGDRFWFSYKTLVAFGGPQGVVVRTNDWGPTTGKHLNAIDGGNKKARLDEAAFKAAFTKTFGHALKVSA